MLTSILIFYVYESQIAVSYLNQLPTDDYGDGRVVRWCLVNFQRLWGAWSGRAKVLGKLPVRGRPTVWMIVGQGPIALAVGAGGGDLDIFALRYLFSSFSLSLGGGPI